MTFADTLPRRQPWLPGSGAGGGGSLGVLRGALVIRGAYPYGPTPDHASNPFFLDELDQVWARDLNTAERIICDYRQRGYNEMAVGPIYAKAYHGHYPDTDWRGQADRFAAYCEWLVSHGVSITLRLFPDCPPYFSGESNRESGRWDIAAIKRDLGPVYQHPTVQRLVPRSVLAWETIVQSDHAVEALQAQQDLMPHAEWGFHNPPGHIWFGLGSEDEQACARKTSAKFHRHYFQAFPPSTPVKPADGGIDRPPKTQMVYDLFDIQRRALGSCPKPPAIAHESVGTSSPFGPPILGADGKPIRLDYSEGCAIDIYHSGLSESVAREWGAEALTVQGVVNLEDGGPTT